MDPRIAQALGTFQRIFGIWIVAFVLVALPLYMLYDVDGFAVYMNWLEITVDASLIVLICAAIALFVAVLASITAFLFSKRTAIVDASFACIAMAIALFFVVRAAKLWVEVVAHQRFPAGSLKVIVFILALAVFVALARKQGVTALLAGIERKLVLPVRLAVSLIVVSLLIVMVAGVRFVGTSGDEIAGNLQPGRDQSPNIFLITIDTLSADDMSTYGYHLPTTPRIDEFAAASYVFDNAFANCNFTTPAITSILTGKYPVSHRVFQLYGHLRNADREQNLPKILKGAGYQTGAVVSNPWAHPLHIRFRDAFDYLPLPRGLGVQRALMRFLLRFRDANLISSLNELFVLLEPILDAPYDSKTAVPPGIVYRDAESYLGRTKAGRPVFLWTHVSPPHEPYLSPEPYKQMFLRNSDYLTASSQDRIYGPYPPDMQSFINELRLRYDEYIAYTDNEVGSYLGYLRDKGYFENSVIILTADHGQSFDKGFYGHGGPHLYQSLVHIPLLIHMPRQKFSRRVRSNAEQIDIPVTILSLLGKKIPSWMEGESLLHGMTDENFMTSKPKFSSNFELNNVFEPISRGSVAVFRGNYKYTYNVADGAEGLYAFTKDNAELNELSKTDRQQASSMRSLVMLHVNRHIRP